MTRSLPRRQNSRYQGTPAFQLRDRNNGNLTSSYSYGIWEPPTFVERRSSRLYTVTAQDIGRLDLLANRFLNSVNLWWVLAYVNNISDPTTDMFVGQELTIPRIADVRSGLSNLENQGRVRSSLGR